MACVGQLSSADRHFDSISLPGVASRSSANPSSPTSNTSGASISQDPLPMHLSTSNVIRIALSNRRLAVILLASVPPRRREGDHAIAKQRMQLLAVSLGTRVVSIREVVR